MLWLESWQTPPDDSYKQMKFEIQNIALKGHIYTIRRAGEQDLPLIQEQIRQMKLNDGELEASQFTIARTPDSLIGFGHLKEHGNFFELSSLGIISMNRNQGLGSSLVEELISQTRNLHVHPITRILDFFVQFGFRIITKVPAELETKFLYCCQKCRNHATVNETCLAGPMTLKQWHQRYQSRVLHSL